MSRALCNERVIDIPIESLPFVDEHEVIVAAPIDRVWEGLVKTIAESTGRGGLVAGALGCEQTERAGEPGRIGSTIPGFVVARSVRPSVLALMGAHRFSRYALIFRLTETLEGPIRLSAETRAEFPGVKGHAYRTAVVTSRGHTLATASLLRTIRRRAERS